MTNIATKQLYRIIKHVQYNTSQKHRTGQKWIEDEKNTAEKAKLYTV